MDKNLVLLVGCGRTGNVLVSEMIERDHRYVGLMINSSLNDMNTLKNFNLADHYIFPGQDGSGRNRDVAKSFVKKRVESIVDIIVKYNQQQNIIFFTSIDGGTGSGSTPLICKALRRAIEQNVCPDKHISIVAVMPRLSENELSLSNSIGFWNDLVDLKKKNLVNTIYLVDNNRRDTFEEINQEVSDSLDMAFSLNDYDITGTIDKNDSKIVNTAPGYSFIMPLSTQYTDLSESIEVSIKNNVFISPANYDCDYMGAVVQKDFYKVEDLRNKFEVFKVDYCGYSNNKNLIVMGGLNLPKQGIDNLQMALRDAKNKIKERYVENDLYVNLEDKPKQIKPKVKVETSTVSSDVLNNLYDDDFWND